MARVELRLSPLPAHVRTGRLVGVAAARRAGLDHERVDEMRLALGEACSRAVSLHASHAPDEPVVVTVEDSSAGLVVRVTDRGPATGDSADLAADLLNEMPADGAEQVAHPGVALAVLRGLVDDLEIEAGPDGTTVTMRWPLELRPGGGTGPASTAATVD
ncbi:MAG TPA: ATP-binding protein [Mycobacteriales bacterium]|nr:ATP-binding protein [Mycobacteriales bacterium]